MRLNFKINSTRRKRLIGGSLFLIIAVFTFFTGGTAGHAFLKWSIISNHNSVGKTALYLGARIERRSPGELPLICYALQRDNFLMIDELIKHGADINESNDTKFIYPLALAVAGNKIEMTKFLVSRGADVNRRTEYWGSPIEIAKEYRFNELIALLKKAGAKE